MADEVIAAMQNNRGGRGNRGVAGGMRRHTGDDDSSSYGGTPSRSGGYSPSRGTFNGQEQGLQRSLSSRPGGFSPSQNSGHEQPAIPRNLSSPPGQFNNQMVTPPLAPTLLRVGEGGSQWSAAPQNASFAAPVQSQFKRNVEVHESMILDGRTVSERCLFGVCLVLISLIYQQLSIFFFFCFYMFISR